MAKKKGTQERKKEENVPRKSGFQPAIIDSQELIVTPASIQAHVMMLQNIVGRMSGNSAKCKQWCVTTETALLALVYNNNIQSHSTLLVTIPIILFCFLDCYYLGIERSVIYRQNDFMKHVQDNDIAFIREKIFRASWRETPTIGVWFTKIGNQLLATLKAFFSLSTAFFYIALCILALVISTPSKTEKTPSLSEPQTAIQSDEIINTHAESEYIITAQEQDNVLISNPE